MKHLRNVITRAVREKNPDILLETGLSNYGLVDKIKDSGCLLKLGPFGGCNGLSCYRDSCPFNSVDGHTKNTAKQWILGGKGASKLGPQAIPRPVVSTVVSKKGIFKEQKDVSLEDLLSSV